MKFMFHRDHSICCDFQTDNSKIVSGTEKKKCHETIAIIQFRDKDGVAKMVVGELEPRDHSLVIPN